MLRLSSGCFTARTYNCATTVQYFNSVWKTAWNYRTSFSIVLLERDNTNNIPRGMLGFSYIPDNIDKKFTAYLVRNRMAGGKNQWWNQKTALF